MQSYNFESPRSSAEADTAARPPDPRLVAFSGLLDSIDRSDWRAGLEATRRLRALGLSVCLLPKPPGDRRRA